MILLKCVGADMGKKGNSASHDYGQGVPITNFLYPKTAPVRWDNRGEFNADTGLSGPRGTGIEAYSSPLAPRVGAPAVVLFGARSRVGF